jgi:hypothetical protein
VGLDLGADYIRECTVSWFELSDFDTRKHCLICVVHILDVSSGMFVCDSRCVCENQVLNVQMRFIFILQTLQRTIMNQAMSKHCNLDRGLKLSLCSRF